MMRGVCESHLCAICCCQQQDTWSRFKTVELCQKLIEGLISLFVQPQASPSACNINRESHTQVRMTGSAGLRSICLEADSGLDWSSFHAPLILQSTLPDWCCWLLYILCRVLQQCLHSFATHGECNEQPKTTSRQVRQASRWIWSDGAIAAGIFAARNIIESERINPEAV